MRNSRMTFKFCGLDAENNFLQAPICPCGCGQYMNLILKTNQDLYDFIYTMLEEEDCHHCAIFAFDKRWDTIYLGVKNEDGVSLYKMKVNGSVRNCLKDMQDNVQFHHYGLLEQIDSESWRIVME